MNIEQTISLKAQEAVKALYGQDVPESMVQLQKTKRARGVPLPENIAQEA